MSLHDALRKAAGLLVELPPEESGPSIQEDVSPEELDRRLREVNQKLQGLNADPSVPPPQPPAQTKTVEQIVRDTDGPNLDQIKVPPSTPPPVMSQDGKMDFGAIYQRAGLPQSQFTAEQMLDMLASLPAELPLEVRRQTVKVSLD